MKGLEHKYIGRELVKNYLINKLFKTKLSFILVSFLVITALSLVLGMSLLDITISDEAFNLGPYYEILIALCLIFFSCLMTREYQLLNKLKWNKHKYFKQNIVSKKIKVEDIHFSLECGGKNPRELHTEEKMTVDKSLVNFIIENRNVTKEVAIDFIKHFTGDETFQDTKSKDYLLHLFDDLLLHINIDANKTEWIEIDANYMKRVYNLIGKFVSIVAIIFGLILSINSIYYLSNYNNIIKNGIKVNAGIVESSVDDKCSNVRGSYITAEYKLTDEKYVEVRLDCAKHENERVPDMLEIRYLPKDPANLYSVKGVNDYWFNSILLFIGIWLTVAFGRVLITLASKQESKLLSRFQHESSTYGTKNYKILLKITGITIVATVLVVVLLRYS